MIVNIKSIKDFVRVRDMGNNEFIITDATNKRGLMGVPLRTHRNHALIMRRVEIPVDPILNKCDILEMEYVEFYSE